MVNPDNYLKSRNILIYQEMHKTKIADDLHPGIKEGIILVLDTGIAKESLNASDKSS